jgi:Do/DeqQ family serine protease
MKSNLKLILTVVLVSFLAGLGGAFTFSYLQPEKSEEYRSGEFPEYRRVSVRESYATPPLTTDFVAASAASTPNVVYIKTSSTAYAQNDFFDFFLGRDGREQSVISSGSGVIYSADGYIVTNNHVIENATKIDVIHNRRSYEAKLVGTDPSTDLALLKIEGKNLPAAKLARSRDVQVGEWVLAVGNPFNLESTVTAGIVSAKGRNINILNSQFPIESFIQTDAAINPGNSGGALVNSRGELIGINTAILSRTGTYTGYGFAVPVDIVVKTVKDLIQYGEVQKAFLGAEVGDLNSETAKKYEISEYAGVLVTYLEAGGAAEKAGIRKGDVILKMNSENINSKAEFNEQLSYYRPGDKVTVAYRRGTQTKEVVLSLTNREGTTAVLKRETFSVEGLGADLEAISKVERDKLKIGGGVRVMNVRKGLMGRLGIEEGFVITAINRQPVAEPKEVAQMLSNARGRVIIEGIDKKGVGSYYQFYF